MFENQKPAPLSAEGEKVMRTTAFFSHGHSVVDKSGLLAGLAKHLIMDEKRKVVMLDLNFSAPRLHHYWEGNLFGEATPVNKGMVDYFLYYQRNEFQASDRLYEYCLPIAGTNSFLMPAGQEPSSEYVQKTLSIDFLNLVKIRTSDATEYVSAYEYSLTNLLLRHIQRSIEREYEPEILLVDTPELISCLGNSVLSYMQLGTAVWPKTAGDHAGRDIAIDCLNFLGTESVICDSVEQTISFCQKPLTR